MAAGFPTAADTGPHLIYTHAPSNDPREVLPEAAARKMVALHQRVRDAHAAQPPFEDMNEQAEAVLRHQKRIRDLTMVKSAGGFGLPETAEQVLSEHRKLERATTELSRLRSLKDIRGARWTVAAQLERRISDWLLKGGVPGGNVLEEVEDQPLSVLLTKNDNGRIEAALERYRHRLRELAAADRHRVNSSPWPSSVAKAAARAHIEQLAEAGTPNLDSMVEHGSPLAFQTTSLAAMVRGIDQPALVHAETVDVLGTMCWLFKDQMLAKITAGIDEVADDKAAMNEQQRQQILAQIGTDELATERMEVACVWAAEAAGNVIDFRSGTSPLALLGVRLVAAPAVNGAGTSPGLAWEVNDPGRRR